MMSLVMVIMAIAMSLQVGIISNSDVMSVPLLSAPSLCCFLFARSVQSEQGRRRGEARRWTPSQRSMYTSERGDPWRLFLRRCSAASSRSLLCSLLCGLLCSRGQCCSRGQRCSLWRRRGQPLRALRPLRARRLLPALLLQLPLPSPALQLPLPSFRRT